MSSAWVGIFWGTIWRGKAIVISVSHSEISLFEGDTAAIKDPPLKEIHWISPF